RYAIVGARRNDQAAAAQQVPELASSAHDLLHTAGCRTGYRNSAEAQIAGVRAVGPALFGNVGRTQQTVVALMMSPEAFRSSRMIAAILLAALAPSGIALTQSKAQTTAGAAPPSRPLESAASAGAFRHLRALQDIASANGGNRAAGTPGYDRS